MPFLFRVGERDVEVSPIRNAGGLSLEIDGVRVDARLEPLADGAWQLVLDGVPERVFIASEGSRSFVHLRGRSLEVTQVDPIAQLRQAKAAEGGHSLVAPMPGVVVEVRVAPGARVAAGDSVLVIESMKLQTTLSASADGRVEALPFAVGQTFEKGAVLARIESLKEPSSPGEST